MKKPNIIGKAEVLIFLEDPTKKDIIKKILKEIPYYQDIGYAGYISKEATKKFLNWSIYGKEQEKSWNKVNIKEEQIKQVIKKCEKIIKNKVKIFIFPTLDKFIINNMKGVAGFSPWKNTIIINIYKTKEYEKALEETICHELAHAIALNYNKRETIQDNLIFEGIAEHFREHILKGKKADWVKAISKQKAKEILKEIKKDLPTINHKLSSELFFGTGKYPRWTGYSVGYYLVEAYLKKTDKKDWNKIIKAPIKDIIKDNMFLKQKPLLNFKTKSK